MRTQQLLNYTHEHVSQTRQESERRMNEQMVEGIQASHSRLNEVLQVQTRSLQNDIQAHLRAEREHHVAEVERQLAVQARQCSKYVEASEERIRTEMRAHMSDLECKVEGTKSWTQHFFQTAMESCSTAVNNNATAVMRAYVDDRLQQRDSSVADLISAQLRAERQKLDSGAQKLVADSARELELRFDAKLNKLQHKQERKFVKLRAEMATQGHNQQDVVSNQSILQHMENIIDSRIKAEVNQAMTSFRNSIEATMKSLHEAKSDHETASSPGRQGRKTSYSNDQPALHPKGVLRAGAGKVRRKPTATQTSKPQAVANLSRLNQIRAELTLETALRAAERASALEKSHQAKVKALQYS